MAHGPWSLPRDHCMSPTVPDDATAPPSPPRIAHAQVQSVSAKTIVTSANGPQAPGPRQHASYAPQFKATAQLILSRFRAMDRGPASNVPGQTPSSTSADDAGDDRPDGPNPADELTVALPTGPPPLSSGGASSSQHGLHHAAAVSSSLKRKRDQGYEVPDFTQDTVSLPASKAPARQANAATLPAVRGDTRAAADAQDTCSASTTDCSANPSWPSTSRPPSITDGVAAAQPELVGFCAGEASDFLVTLKRSRYFLKKTRAELLRILAYCDQIRPQLLSDILVSVSKKHPELPIFDSADWQRSVSDAPSSRASQALQGSRPTGRPRHGHGHAATNPTARQRQKNAKKAFKRLILAQSGPNEQADEEDAYAEDETLPPTWPKAGEGLYAKLPPETEDRALLMDENDDEAFSQFLVDKFGKPVAVPACA
ncbi:hypothetical protein UVI_02020550 [Ustilaginoidea virens]|uniref:Uncharacterized protein n=1 Tax=Ustilaginoidea virens TaxID=1159556 RepID=A0A1B5KX53_USTVR|nr:hypothetical protein UVI_02020550 [Ustilaginoidea virens]